MVTRGEWAILVAASAVAATKIAPCDLGLHYGSNGSRSVNIYRLNKCAILQFWLIYAVTNMTDTPFNISDGFIISTKIRIVSNC